jgi:hypothetical protein
MEFVHTSSRTWGVHTLGGTWLGMLGHHIAICSWGGIHLRTPLRSSKERKQSRTSFFLLFFKKKQMN